MLFFIQKNLEKNHSSVFLNNSSVSARGLSLLMCTLKTAIFYGMMRQNVIEVSQCVWGTVCLYRQVEEFCAVKMETTLFPKRR